MKDLCVLGSIPLGIVRKQFIDLETAKGTKEEVTTVVVRSTDFRASIVLEHELTRSGFWASHAD